MNSNSKNLATINKSDFTVTDNGDAFISVRKAAELTGIPKSTIHRWVSENRYTYITDENSQLSSEVLQKLVLLGHSKGYTNCLNLVEKFMEAGAKAFIYHSAGYEVKAVKLETRSRLELAKEQVMLLEQLELAEEKVTVLEVTLDQSQQWSSVKKQEARLKRDFTGRPLKGYSLSNNLTIKKVFDQNYGEVDSYCAEAWLEVYGVEL